MERETALHPPHFMPMLVLDEIHTYYGDSHVLQGLSLQVNAGEIVALLGRTGLPSHRIARLGVGLVPQGRGIFPALTVRENILLAARAARDGGWTLDRVLATFPP